MITFLTIDMARRRFLPFGNKITVDVKTSGGLSVKHINCLCRKSKVPWGRIEKISEDEAGRLLVKEDVVIPEDSSVRRFADDELKSRLCLNMAVAVLKNTGGSAKKLKVAVFDPDARIADGVGALLKFTDNLTVVTRGTDIYSAEAQRIMDECGAVLNVSRRVKSLSTAGLVVAPVKLDLQLPLGKESVILTTQRPAVTQRGAVYYKYYFDLGKELMDMMPEGFDAEYFASALYSLSSRFELGSVIPQATKGDGTDHTLLSVSKYLMNIAANT